jgi:hypothetical protein
MNPKTLVSRLAAAVAALTVTFTVFSTISTAFLDVPADMLAKAKAARPVVVASAR